MEQYAIYTLLIIYQTDKWWGEGNSILTWSHWGNAAGHENLQASLCAGQHVFPDYSKLDSTQYIFLGDPQQILDVTESDAGQFHQENSPRIREREMNTMKTRRIFSIVQSFLLDKKKAFGFVVSISPCLQELPSPSQSLHVCAVEPAHWPSHVHSCLYLMLDSFPLSILLFHQHLWFEWREGKKRIKMEVRLGSLIPSRSLISREALIVDHSIKLLPKMTQVNIGKIGQ